jgi:hypothetical protein
VVASTARLVIAQAVAGLAARGVPLSAQPGRCGYRTTAQAHQPRPIGCLHQTQGSQSAKTTRANNQTQIALGPTAVVVWRSGDESKSSCGRFGVARALAAPSGSGCPVRVWVGGYARSGKACRSLGLRVRLRPARLAW